MLRTQTPCGPVSERPAVNLISALTDDDSSQANNTDDRDFFSRQARLQAEAKLALAQVRSH